MEQEKEKKERKKKSGESKSVCTSVGKLIAIEFRSCFFRDT